MDTAAKTKFYRWVLLEHTGAPDDFKGIHYDLLLEDKQFCRSWRLSDIPIWDGPYVNAVYIAPHNLEWLNIKEKFVSGNRGIATRIKQGVFLNSLPIIEDSPINLSLKWEGNEGVLVIDENGCRILRK